MTSVRIEKPGQVGLFEIAAPDLRADEIAIRPLAAGVCGTDVHILQGDFIGFYPVVPGHEFCGSVQAIGQLVHDWKVGDIAAVDPNIRCTECPACLKGRINLCERYEAIGVTRPGAFAETVHVPVAQAHRFSGNPSDGAFAEPLACVLYGLSRLDVQPGMQAAVWGAGAIGLLHLQVLSRLLDCRVTLIEPDPRRLGRAKELHPENTVAIDLHTEQALRAICPNGFDIAVDASGQIAALAQLFRHLRRGGEALLFGVYPDRDRLQISPFQVFYNDWKIMGSFTYRHEFARAVSLLESKVIQGAPLVDEKIALSELPDRLQRLAAGDQTGKVQVCHFG
ncbi:alcohol dehydrogenase catalytic domain-containing protein [candidate division KSB1 bacterium]|nr:alcohol dehydrogenase catalytic domain-containing protein [candidate division KSB1 bacterium]